MPRNISFKIPIEYNNKKVVHFLRGSAQLSVRLINALKRCEDGIMLNDTHARTIDLLSVGDTLTVNIPDDKVLPEPICMPLDIVYEDNDIIAVNKSPFLAMHPTHNHQGNTLANAMAWHLKQKGVSTAFRAIGRLDKGTSGVVICALNKYAAARLTGNIQKTYIAIVQGVFEGEGTIDQPICRPDPMKTLRACGEQGDRAVTHWQSLGTGDGRSLLRIRLETGRTHQIRVHFAHIGAPLCGDSMYGGTGFSHQLLHCESAEFIHPVTGHPLKITAPLPWEMIKTAQNIPPIVV
ncbi:MAG: RluA family pseudouridine synthase [Clostridiales bacterium]|nr:RluA family pseudouridine synthase [Clostridiales bacterium]